MPSSIFYPYRFASEALEVSGLSVDIDAEANAGNDYVNFDHRSMLLTSFEKDWEEIVIRVKVTDPNQQVGEVLPENADHSVIAVWLVARNKTTRLRKSAQLEKNEECWEGQISLSRSDIARTTEFDCYAVLSTAIDPEAGFAFKAHERIADSSSWKLYTDIVPAMPGGALNGEWVDFEKSANTELKKRADCIWHLDLTDSESPRLLLNEGVPRLRQTLEVEGNRKRSARARDALLHSILQAVINELAVFSLSNGAGVPLDEHLEWQKKLLTSLARKSDSGSEEIVASRWIDSWYEGSDAGQVLAEISTAVQRHVNLRLSSENLAKAVESEVGND